MAMARILTGAAGGALLAAGLGAAAAAHHGWNTYSDTNVTITGTVTELRLGNPHDRLTVTDAEGQEWDVWLGPPIRNRQNGFSETSASIGDTIEVFGDRDPARLEIKSEKLTINGEDFLIYPDRLAASYRAY